MDTPNSLPFASRRSVSSSKFTFISFRSTSMIIVKYSWSIVWLISRILMLQFDNSVLTLCDDSFLVFTDNGYNSTHKLAPFIRCNVFLLFCLLYYFFYYIAIYNRGKASYFVKKLIFIAGHFF